LLTKQNYYNLLQFVTGIYSNLISKRLKVSKFIYNKYDWQWQYAFGLVNYHNHITIISQVTTVHTVQIITNKLLWFNLY